MANFPTSIENGSNLPNPTGSSYQNSPDHASLHTTANDAIKAIETKLGTGASTPVNNRLLYGNGTGSSTWTQLSSAQLAASMSDETGSGLLVFGTTPTLITPKIDTINENTLNNGVTIDGLNIKDGALNAANSVPSNAIQTNAVQASNLATNAITLGYVQITSNFATASSTSVQVTGLTVTVTIPAGGRRIRVSCNSTSMGSAGVGVVEIWDGTVGSGTQIGQWNAPSGLSSGVEAKAIVTPSAGSVKTYNVAIRSAAGGTNTLAGATTGPAYLLVEVI